MVKNIFTSTLQLWIKCTQHLSTGETCLKIERARTDCNRISKINTEEVMCKVLISGQPRV